MNVYAVRIVSIANELLRKEDGWIEGAYTRRTSKETMGGWSLKPTPPHKASFYETREAAQKVADKAEKRKFSGVTFQVVKFVCSVVFANEPHWPSIKKEKRSR